MPIKFICKICGKEFKVPPSRAKLGLVKYCSQKCRGEGWSKLPYQEYDGYRFYKNVHGYYYSSKLNVILNRYKYQKIHGSIPKNSVVHHIDENKDNNDINNLELKQWGIHTGHHNRIYAEGTKCKHEECDRKTRAKGLCLKHYQRMKAKERGYWL